MTDIPQLPPASEAQGDPGHDDALERMRGTSLIRDRALGLTYPQLGEKHGYTDGSGARTALLRALDRHEAENAWQLRLIENERYELDQAELRAIIMNRSLGPTTRIRAIEARTRASARHARLNGLDSPVQVVMSASVAAALADAIAEVETVLGEVVQG